MLAATFVTRSWLMRRAALAIASTWLLISVAFWAIAPSSQSWGYLFGDLFVAVYLWIEATKRRFGVFTWLWIVIWLYISMIILTGLGPLFWPDFWWKLLGNIIFALIILTVTLAAVIRAIDERDPKRLEKLVDRLALSKNTNKRSMEYFRALTAAYSRRFARAR